MYSSYSGEKTTCLSKKYFDMSSTAYICYTLLFLDCLHDLNLQVTLKSNGTVLNPDKSVWDSDPAPSYKILTKNICCKTFRKRFEKEIL